MKNRIEYLDGLRGLAILMVIGYHSFVRWPKIVPYGNKFADFALFEAGWLGVQLFFILSGFVILMTLERCKSFKHFVYRRWIRLFPAMLASSILIYATMDVFHERPLGHSSLASVIPGLTFIEPLWWKTITGFPNDILEGAFWSLYVEFKFYIFAGLMYFWKGQKAVVFSCLAVYVLYVLSHFTQPYFDHPYLLKFDHIFTELSFMHFGWFSAGAAFYLYFKDKNYKWYFTGLGIAFLSSVFVQDLNWKTSVVAALISLFFAVSLINPWLQYCLSRKILLFLGFVSYPLYLIHQNIMISLIVKTENLPFDIPPVLLPVIPTIAVVAMAYIISKYVEGGIKHLIVSVQKKIAERLRTQP